MMATLKSGEVIGPYDCVMFAIGRHPVTSSLGLESTGATVDKLGRVRVDDYQWTGIEGLYCLGDASHRAMSSHLSRSLRGGGTSRSSIRRYGGREARIQGYSDGRLLSVRPTTERSNNSVGPQQHHLSLSRFFSRLFICAQSYYRDDRADGAAGEGGVWRREHHCVYLALQADAVRTSSPPPSSSSPPQPSPHRIPSFLLALLCLAGTPSQTSTPRSRWQ